MEKEIIIELIKWSAGIVGGVFLIAVGIISYFWRRDRKTIDIRFEKGDKKFDQIQKEVHELATTTKEAIGVLKTNVSNNSKLIDEFKKRRK
jgi:hypothetical protein